MDHNLKNINVEGNVNATVANFGTLNIHGDLIINQQAARFPLPLPEKPIFISYSRTNREFAEKLSNNLEALGFTVWRDVHHMQVSDDWWRQITEAIESSHTMILCMSPGALASEVVMREWNYAREVGTRVMPVFADDIDFDEVPLWMKRADWADFRPDAKEQDAVWARFVDQLRRGYELRRVPYMVDTVPDYFVNRPKEFDNLLNVLVNENGALKTTVAIQGLGGFGKTTLALALCHTKSVRAAFDDGILWVTLGEESTPEDTKRDALDLIEIITGQRVMVETKEAIKAELTKAIGDRYILLVIDDLWGKSDADIFLTDNLNSTVLITTRFDHILDHILPDRINIIKVDVMTDEESVALLSWGIEGIDEAHNKSLEALVERLGNWALIIRLVNATLRKRIRRGESIDKAIEHADLALTHDGLSAFSTKTYSRSQSNNQVSK